MVGCYEVRMEYEVRVSVVIQVRGCIEAVEGGKAKIYRSAHFEHPYQVFEDERQMRSFRRKVKSPEHGYSLHTGVGLGEATPFGRMYTRIVY
jgi:hypothetical protein